MDEYISREEIGKTIERLINNRPRGGVLSLQRMCLMIIDAVRNAPAADVVEVVRCRDCVYEDTPSCYLCYIEQHTLRFINHDADFYCGVGKRKGGAGE